MQVLWEKGHATVGEVHKSIPGKRPLAYNTVLTMLRILEQKGHVRHVKKGRAFVYYPIKDRLHARRTAVRYVVSRFFDNAPELLLLNIIEHSKLKSAQLQRVRKLIDARQ